MATKLWAIALVLFCTLLTSSAQIFYKFAVDKLEWNILSIITNYYLIIGLLLYVIGAILLIISFRGGEVSVLYPIIATSYIWVSILSIYFFHEMMNNIKWIGVFIIVAGVALLGYHSNKSPIEGAKVA
jgi:drug/metabolite transporter (DMT)-like permease